MSRTKVLWRAVPALLLVLGVLTPVSSPGAAAASDIPEYTQLLPACDNPSAAKVPCHWPDPSNTDSPVVILVKCNQIGRAHV